MDTKHLIYNFIEPTEGKKAGWELLYDIPMLIVIVLSIVPMAFRTQYACFSVFENVATVIFILDYLVRWSIADVFLPDRPKWQAYLLYPFTPFAIVDLLSILPGLSVINSTFKLFRITRLLRILRVFKLTRYSKNIQILFRVLSKERSILLTVLTIAIGYIIITALIMFNCEESDQIQTFGDALYWATTTLTTVGYGDICPHTEIGKIISMCSALMGVAVIALPSGVITASYLEELRNKKQDTDSNEELQK